MNLPPYICQTCNDIGSYTKPAPLGKSWCHPCEDCAHLQNDPQHIAKVYKRWASLPGPDGENAESWLRWRHSRIADEVLAIVESERPSRAVQLSIF